MTDDPKPWYAPGAVDEKALYVAARREFVLAFDVQPDGRIRNQRNFGRIAEPGHEGGADGLAIDKAGRVYVAAIKTHKRVSIAADGQEENPTEDN